MYDTFNDFMQTKNEQEKYSASSAINIFCIASTYACLDKTQQSRYYSNHGTALNFEANVRKIIKQHICSTTVKKY
jgi:hypothetical protein